MPSALGVPTTTRPKLWNRIPHENHPPDKELVENGLANTQISRGVVVSTACGDKDLGTKLVLQNSNGRQTFRSATLHRVGYSDTFFWGRDHYTPCRPLNGLRGIVRYKPDTARGTAGEWLELDLWHDLPPAQSSSAATPHSPATTN